MMTLVIFALVAVAVTIVLQNSAKSKHRTTMRIESEMAARAALDMMARDIRTAGYGADRDHATPQPAIAYVDSLQIILSQNQYPYPDNSAGPVAPLAYNPAATPRPFPIDGTAYAPPIRYRTGAELIRYTLDVNNDGVVDAGDLSAPEGADAAATANPNDYVLVRQVYGDSTGNVPNDNGGVTERVALVRRPGDAGVPPLFNVYFRGANTPWDWSSGPVPQTRLQDIQRIELRVTAAASRPDARGQYSQTTLKSEVNAARSVPDFGASTYSVSGYVFNDTDGDQFHDVGEPGIQGATVRLGNYIAYSNVSGYYQLNAPSGTYVLKHTPAMGYGSAQYPDTFVARRSGGASRASRSRMPRTRRRSRTPAAPVATCSCARSWTRTATATGTVAKWRSRACASPSRPARRKCRKASRTGAARSRCSRPWAATW